MWSLIRKILIFVFIILVLLYLFFLFGLPKIINSPAFKNKAQEIIKEKSGYSILYKGFNFKTNPNLTTSIDLDELTILNKLNKKVLFLNNAKVDFKALKIKPYKVKINYLYFDKSNLNKSNKKSKFDFTSLPEISLNKADIILQKGSRVSFSNVIGTRENKKYSLSFMGTVTSKYLIKNITLKSDKQLYILNDGIYSNKLALSFNFKPSIFIEGLLYKKGKSDFTLKASNVDNIRLKEAFLFLRKQIQPEEKNFIENFYGFYGTADINLHIKNKNIFGEASLKDFKAISVKFNIPFYYKKGTFYFMGDKVSLKTEGTFGGEKLYSDFFSNHIFDPDKRYSIGTMVSNVGHKFFRTYIPESKLIGRMDLKVKYYIHQKKPEVEYFALLKEGSNVYYKKMCLNSIDLKRTVYAKTKKIKNKLYLKTYNFSVDNKVIFLGDGLFDRMNNKFYLNYITLKTNSWVDTNILGRYLNFIKQGLFNLNIRYEAKTKSLFGSIDLKINKIQYKKMVLENILINSYLKDNIIEFKTNEVNFAEGILKAQGCYNVKSKASEILFNADNINSNLASNMFFKLQDQLEGRAHARLRFITYDNFKNIQTKGSFSIDDGRLTKLGSRGFFIKNSFKLQKMINIDLDELKAKNAKITGKFDYDVKNKILKNIEIINQNKMVALYIEGCWGVLSQSANLVIWGKYNKNIQKGVKIYFIPLSLVTKIMFKNEYSKECLKDKIAKIPFVEGKNKDIEIIRINILGNINTSKNLKVKLRSIK